MSPLIIQLMWITHDTCNEENRSEDTQHRLSSQSMLPHTLVIQLCHLFKPLKSKRIQMLLMSIHGKLVRGISQTGP